MEKWDIYNKDLEKIGKTCVRGEYELQENEYHLVVHIWLLTKEGKILLTQRAENKKTDPLKWESNGGSILAGENLVEGAQRETKEEIGIDLTQESLQLFRSERRDHYHDFYFAYYAIVEEDIIDEIEFTDGEVIDKKWVTKEEFDKLYDKGEIVNNLIYFKEEYKNIF